MDPVEIEKIAELLKKLEPGFLPYPIFTEIARLVTMVTVEVAVLLKESGTLKIMLLKRPADDKWWPNEWHVPGSVLRSTDAKDSFRDAFRRIEEECGCKFNIEPIYFKNHFRQEKRGAMLGIQHYIVLDKKIEAGTFYGLDKLPADMVNEHRIFIHALIDKKLINFSN